MPKPKQNPYEQLGTLASDFAKKYPIEPHLARRSSPQNSDDFANILRGGMKDLSLKAVIARRSRPPSRRSANRVEIFWRPDGSVDQKRTLTAIEDLDTNNLNVDNPPSPQRARRVFNDLAKEINP